MMDFTRGVEGVLGTGVGGREGGGGKGDEDVEEVEGRVWLGW